MTLTPKIYVLVTTLLISTCFGTMASASTNPTRRSVVQLARLQVSSNQIKNRTEMLNWARQLRLRTSIEMTLRPTLVRASNRRLFRYPLLILRGDRSFKALKAKSIRRLRTHLNSGGMLIVDDAALTGPSAGFHRDIQRLAKSVLNRPIVPIPKSDVVYRTFYRLRRALGRRADTDRLYGVQIKKRWALIYSRNDLLGAFQMDPRGGFAHAAVPGGRAQREQAWRLAINLVIYSLCLDYKDDQTHVQYLLRRRRGR
ncbi:MAG TPA: hypothetical protein DCQ06_07270 [Myxococcales bacterium]|nr:hypothetical protein [Myxococcales bacterium]HAN31381.1 hypothetical protein [Myxococcales bacterium]